MTAQPVKQNEQPIHLHVEKKGAERLVSCVSTRCIGVALGAILLLTSLGVAGLLNSQGGYYSLAIAAGGFLLSAPCFFLDKIKTCLSSADPFPDKNHLITGEKIKSLKEPTQQARRVKEKEEDTPKSLLPLLRLKVKDQSLQQSLPKELFLDSEGDLDWTLLGIPLGLWLNPNRTNEYELESHIKALQDPERAKRRDLLNARLNLLDSEIGLKERIKLLRKDPYIDMSMLLPAWSDSELRFRLMMDKELSELTVGDLKTPSDQQGILNIYVRLERLGQRRSDIPRPSSVLDSLLLIDLVGISASEILKQPKKFPLVTFLLMHPEELQELNMKMLSAQQIELIIAQGMQITDTQINDGLLLIENLECLDRWGEKEILRIDFNQMTPPIFNFLFTVEGWPFSRGAKLLSELPDDRVYQLLHHFTEVHWPYLKITTEFDLNRIPEEKRYEAINAIFDFSIMGTFSPAYDLYHTLIPQQQEFVRRYLSEESLEIVNRS